MAEGERRLLLAFQNGEQGAFAPLLQPHLPALLALARRHAGDAHHAEDLVQEVLVRAFRNLTGFRGEASLRTWLFRILVRLASEPRRWRRTDAIDAVPTAWPEEPVGHMESAEHHAIGRELGARLDEAMERLPPRQRTALHLRAVAGLDYAGIAEVLDCSPGAARMLVLEARRKVMDRLGEHLEP